MLCKLLYNNVKYMVVFTCYTAFYYQANTSWVCITGRSSNKHRHIEFFLDIFQQNQYHATLFDAAQRSSNATWFCKQQQWAQPLHLPSQQSLGPSAPILFFVAGYKHPTLAVVSVQSQTQRWKQQQAISGQPLDVVVWEWAAKLGICGWSRSNEIGTAESNQSAGGENLKRRREERWDEFYTHQHSSRVAEADGR